VRRTVLLTLNEKIHHSDVGSFKVETKEGLAAMAVNISQMSAWGSARVVRAGARGARRPTAGAGGEREHRLERVRPQ